MGKRRTLWMAGVLGLAVVLQPATTSLAQAEPGPQEQVEALLDKYAEYRRKDDYTRLRMSVLRDLGQHRLPGARAGLFKILKATKSPDERIIAVGSLAQIADLGTAKDLASWVLREDEPELFHALSERLADCPDEEVGKWLASEALSTNRVALLATFVRAVRLRKAKDALPRLVALYGDGAVDEKRGSTRTVNVLHEVVRAIGALGGPDAKPPLLKAAMHTDWRIRLAAADVLPHQDGADEDVHTRIRTLFTDDTPQVIEALAREVGNARLEPLIPTVIDALESAPRLRTRHACYVALRAFSKLDFHFDAGAWRTWWKHRNDPTKTPQDIERITFARYYGGYVFSDRVLFLADLSGSMEWPSRKETHRIHIARDQLFGVLAAFPDGHLFNVLTFSNKVRAWSRRAMPLDDKNRERARKWIDKNYAEPDGDTYTYDALLHALENDPECDTLYLLSDGNPSDGRYKSSEGIRAMVAVRNRYRRVAIHTITLTLISLDPGRPIVAEQRRLPQMRAFMKALALENYGTTRLIQRPPKK